MCVYNFCIENEAIYSPVVKSNESGKRSYLGKKYRQQEVILTPLDLRSSVKEWNRQTIYIYKHLQTFMHVRIYAYMYV